MIRLHPGRRVGPDDVYHIAADRPGADRNYNKNAGNDSFKKPLSEAAYAILRFFFLGSDSAF